MLISKKRILELEVLRFQVRMAKDLKALPFDSHGHANKQVGLASCKVG